MPFQKGRFLVTEEEHGPGSGSNTGKKQRQEKVKRGRFLVSCLPCVPCVLSPQNSDSGLQDGQQLLARSKACYQRQESLDSTSDKDQICEQHIWNRDTSSCAVFSELGTVTPSCKGVGRRVRFSEQYNSSPEKSTCSAWQAADAAPCSPAAPAAPLVDSRGCLDSPPAFPPVASPPPAISTRSYCKGRFVVQEAVVTSRLARSYSVPDTCSLGQIVQPSGSCCPSMQLSDSSSSTISIGSCPTAADATVLLHRGDAASAAVAAAVSCGYWPAASAVDCQQLQYPSSQISATCELALGTGSAGKVSSRHQHRASHRSQAVSYFRRGRFLVQTTYL